ncbi:MAG TPA: thioredoxin fold domain-containing protein [Puia sp.]|nr:thioredoxin fold domain-containing protein [Puia sp.]
MYRILHSLLLFSAIALSVHLASAQDQAQPVKGVRFEHELSWSAVQARAMTGNKYIFVDCFTTWCGPCRYMRTTIFPQEEAGNFFNDKFVSVEVQLDTTAKDNDHVKGWYADAHQIMTQYGIHAFPTYLIFAPNGRIVHRIVGGRETAREFIGVAREAFDTSRQYYTQLEQFKAGRGDSAFLHRLADQSLGLYDFQDGTPVFKAWLATQHSMYTPTAMHLMENYTQHSSDIGFPVFLHHAAEADKILGAGKAERLVINTLYREYARPQLQSAGADGPDWKAIQTAVAAKYPAQAGEVTARSKVLYYESKKDWPHFQTVIVAYMQKYGAHATPEELNSYAWDVFSNCPDMSCVADALDWSKRSFKSEANPTFMDTYANILYKMGKKDDAIAWEEKALNLSSGNDRANYQSTIDKMRKGEKTWN